MALPARDLRVLVIGGGGREHALVRHLAASHRVAGVYCAPGNAGTTAIARNIPIHPLAFGDLVDLAKREELDLVVVGPSEPLIYGIADAFRTVGIPVFGPSSASARIEGSKAFSKAFMARYGIPTARYGLFDEPELARDFVRQIWEPEGAVIKTDGLADVQSVVVADTLKDALSAVDALMVDRRYGPAGSQVLVEERLCGPEVSLLALMDGERWVSMPPARDHKALLDGNRGPNTEGMGAFTCPDLLPADMLARIEAEIMAPTLRGLAEEGLGYAGVLFVGLMLTAEGPRVLEYNCRLGDPEAQVVLPSLRTDLVDVIEACLVGSLDARNLSFDREARVCVVAATPGYPSEASGGQLVSGLEAAEAAGVTVLHAQTRREGEAVVALGGRAIDVVAQGGTLAEARRLAYHAMGHVALDGERPVLRTDIGVLSLGVPLH